MSAIRLWLVGGRRPLLPIVGALLCVLAAACSTVPYSERTRVILLTEGQERSMGEEAFYEILAQADLSDDAELVALVERVGRRIAAIADRTMAREERDPFDWEFVVIDAPDTVNAFCLPGGKVAFYTGIIPVCKDESGIAVVMAHEIAHALARHGGERVSQQLVINLGISILAAVASNDPETRDLVAAALGVGTGVAFVLPFSRDLEYEADYIGLLLMAEAGYDPRAAPVFWQRMVELAGDEETSFEFLSTHPPGQDRVDQLEANMDEALDFYEEATGERLERYKHVITAE